MRMTEPRNTSSEDASAWVILAVIIACLALVFMDHILHLVTGGRL